jgi:hypothetical protein
LIEATSQTEAIDRRMPGAAHSARSLALARSWIAAL